MLYEPFMLNMVRKIYKIYFEMKNVQEPCRNENKYVQLI